MQNKHVEYRKIVDGSDKAVLFIHGILGSPNHFRDIIPLVPKDYSVLAMVTAGHCSHISDFSRSSLEEWEESVQRSVDELLKTHKEIYLVGHSMGTLLSIEQAIKDSRIKGIFCISVPIKVCVRLRMIPMALKIYRNKIKDSDIITLAFKECYGCTDDKNFFKYFAWIPRFLDLFKLIKRVRKNLYKLNTPCIAFQSIPDELVSPKSIKILQNESNMRVVSLEKSTHFYYDPTEMDLLKEEFNKFLVK